MAYHLPKLNTTIRAYASNTQSGTQNSKSFYLPDIGEGIQEVEVLVWHVKIGDPVSEWDNLCDVQSDKAATTITSPYSGKILKIHYAVGELAKVGKPLVDFTLDGNIETTESHTEKTNEFQTTKVESPTSDTHTNKFLSSPAVRYLAKKQGVDLSKIKGSGKNGRITKEDFVKQTKVLVTGQEFIKPKEANFEPAKTLSEKAQTQQTVSAAHTKLSANVIPVRGYARAMVNTMTQALSIPHLGYSEEINMDKLTELRKLQKSYAEHLGVKLTFMPFFMKAASLAMKKFPLINSRINKELTEITVIENHNISIAVATNNGLVVPNVKNVQNLSIMEIAKELKRIIDLAQINKLSAEDLKDGTFTITNVGSIGGTYTSPIILTPQVCIVGIGRVQKIPRYNERGEVYPAQIINVSFSADHRVIDGAVIAGFSNLWKQYLENPQSMLLELN